MNLLTEQELKSLSAEIDQHLSELETENANLDNLREGDAISRAGKNRRKAIPNKQKQQLEKITGEDADSFLKKFSRAAKNDLCEEGGALNAKWKKYGDLENEDMLKTFGGILVGMGVQGAVLQTLLVTVIVVIVHISLKAFCEEGKANGEN
jgi:hypothetical protein